MLKNVRFLFEKSILGMLGKIVFPPVTPREWFLKFKSTEAFRLLVTAVNSSGA